MPVMSFLEVKFYFKLLYIGTVYVEEHFTFHSGLESRAVLYILTTLSRPMFSMPYACGGLSGPTLRPTFYVKNF